MPHLSPKQCIPPYSVPQAAVTGLPQRAEEGKPPTTPVWFGEEIHIILQVKRGDRHARSLLASRRNEQSHRTSSIFFCLFSVGRGELWDIILSQEPRKVILSVQVRNFSSVITEGGKGRLAVHRGPKISIIFPSPLLCAPSFPLAAKEKSPSEFTLCLSWTRMTLPLRVLHPLRLTEVMKTKLLALCLFSVISSVCCQQPEPWPFPIQGIAVSSECSQVWWERCASQQPSWAYVKKLRSKPHQDLWCLCLRYWYFSCRSKAGISCRVQGTSGRRGSWRASPASSAAHQSGCKDHQQLGFTLQPFP